jgi:hypothetical protein
MTASAHGRHYVDYRRNGESGATSAPCQQHDAYQRGHVCQHLEPRRGNYQNIAATRSRTRSQSDGNGRRRPIRSPMRPVHTASRDHRVNGETGPPLASTRPYHWRPATPGASRRANYQNIAATTITTRSTRWHGRRDAYGPHARHGCHHVDHRRERRTGATVGTVNVSNTHTNAGTYSMTPEPRCRQLPEHRGHHLRTRSGDRIVVVTLHTAAEPTAAITSITGVNGDGPQSGR